MLTITLNTTNAPISTPTCTGVTALTLASDYSHVPHDAVFAALNRRNDPAVDLVANTTMYPAHATLMTQLRQALDDAQAPSMSTGDTITHTTDHEQPLNTYTCSGSGWVDNEFHHHCTEANARLGGTVRVEESLPATGATLFTIEYRPPTDAPGYPVWKPVTTVLTRTQARAVLEHLDDNPNKRAVT